jgi:hypothetical protein
VKDLTLGGIVVKHILNKNNVRENIFIEINALYYYNIYVLSMAISPRLEI